VGYRNYQPPESPPPDTTTESPPPHLKSDSTLSLDRLRNLGLIAILLGVLMLLLAVWR
jgi:hypothetical protein